MSDEYPHYLLPGDTFNLKVGGKLFARTATAEVTIRNDDDAMGFVAGYTFPHTTVPGETLNLLGRDVVIAVEKTFEWWCSIADGIPELGLFDAV